MSINQDSKQLIKGTSIVALMTLLSRFFGLIRDLLVARLFGASAIADCFFVAFRIPNLLRSFVAEGALSAAFVPIFASELKTGKERAQEVISQVIGFLTIITSTLTILGILFAGDILSLIAPGFMQKGNAALCILLTQIMMPYIICISLVAMLNGALNSVNIFGVAALAQVVMNIALIFGALLAGRYEEVEAVKILAYSVIAGGLLQVMIQIPALSKAGFKFLPKFNLFSRPIYDLVKLMLPAIFGATVYQIAQFLNTLFATLLETGSVSWLFYADRLTQLPIGIFSIALASVLLPTLSKANVDKNSTGFATNLTDSLRYTSFFIIPMAAILFFHAKDLIQILFERGEFTSLDTFNTAIAVQAYSVGLWTVSCHSMLARAFIARRDTVTPTLVGLASLFLSIFMSLILMGSFKSGSSEVAAFFKDLQNTIGGYFPLLDLNHSGLALASSISTYFNFLALALIITLKNIGISWGNFIKTSVKTISAISAAIYISSLIPQITGFNIISSLSHILISVIIFFLISLFIKSKETLEIISLIKRRYFKNA